jgi:hypothetical protein
MTARSIMRLAGLVLLAVIAVRGQDAPRIVVPNTPDLTISTRITGDGPSRQTVTVRLKGARQRTDRTYEAEHGPPAAWPPTISQCDRRRTLILNPMEKTYGYLLIEPPQRATVRRPPGTVLSRLVETRHSTAQATIDAVDTGQRRQFAGLIARHVVTTENMTMEGQTTAASIRVQDGWYVDLPPAGCVDCGDTEMLALGTVIRATSEPAPALPRVTFLGRAKRGFALIETDRVEAAGRAVLRTTELLEISNAPIDAAVFDVPVGYRAALPYPGGGFDFSRPDTIGNRLSLLWEGVRAFATRWWP